MDPVAGHIPGAVNRPASRNLDADGVFKPAAKLRTEFAALLGGASARRRRASLRLGRHRVPQHPRDGDRRPARDAALSRLVERVDREARAADRQSAALTLRPRASVATRRRPRSAARSLRQRDGRILAIATAPPAAALRISDSRPTAPRQIGARCARRAAARRRRASVTCGRNGRALDRETLRRAALRPSAACSAASGAGTLRGAIQATPDATPFAERDRARARTRRAAWRRRIACSAGDARALDVAEEGERQMNVVRGDRAPAERRASVARKHRQAPGAALRRAPAQRKSHHVHVGRPSTGRTRQAEA